MMRKVQPDNFDVAALTSALYDAAKNVGAVATFVGVVRADAVVQALELSHYPGMSEQSLNLIAEEAEARWPLAAVTIVHRVGKLLPGEQIVYVGTASAHRQAALEACAYIADQLKTRAVIWKKEHLADGQRWVEPSDQDVAVAAKWR